VADIQYKFSYEYKRGDNNEVRLRLHYWSDFNSRVVVGAMPANPHLTISQWVDSLCRMLGAVSIYNKLDPITMGEMMIDYVNLVIEMDEEKRRIASEAMLEAKRAQLGLAQLENPESLINKCTREKNVV
jgi:hypothetical protein